MCMIFVAHQKHRLQWKIRTVGRELGWKWEGQRAMGSVQKGLSDLRKKREKKRAAWTLKKHMFLRVVHKGSPSSLNRTLHQWNEKHTKSVQPGDIRTTWYPAEAHAKAVCCPRVPQACTQTISPCGVYKHCWWTGAGRIRWCPRQPWWRRRGRRWCGRWGWRWRGAWGREAGALYDGRNLCLSDAGDVAAENTTRKHQFYNKLHTHVAWGW